MTHGYLKINQPNTCLRHAESLSTKQSSLMLTSISYHHQVAFVCPRSQAPAVADVQRSRQKNRVLCSRRVPELIGVGVHAAETLREGIDGLDQTLRHTAVAGPGAPGLEVPLGEEEAADSDRELVRGAIKLLEKANEIPEVVEVDVDLRTDDEIFEIDAEALRDAEQLLVAESSAHGLSKHPGRGV